MDHCWVVLRMKEIYLVVINLSIYPLINFEISQKANFFKEPWFANFFKV
jgi:hypothetical protein